MNRAEFLKESFHFRKKVLFLNIPVDVLAVDFLNGKVFIHSEETAIIHEWVTIDRISLLEGNQTDKFKIGCHVKVPGELISEDTEDQIGYISDINIEDMFYDLAITFADESIFPQNFKLKQLNGK